MSAARADQVLDEYGRPVPGAAIYVYDLSGNSASIYSDSGHTLAIVQPIIADEFGNYTYYAADNFYREDIWFAGRLRLRQNGVAVGDTAVQFEANLATLAPSKANIDALAGDLTNLNLVAPDLTNINLVAGSVGNVNAVAGDLANINAAAGDLAAINAAPAQAANAANSATAAGNSATAAAASATTAASVVNSAASVPRDPVALWAIDQYSSGFIPNMMASSAVPSTNLKRCSRHSLNGPLWSKQGGTTVTDRTEVGVSGATDASRVTIPGGGRLAFGSNTNSAIPAGTYTIAGTIMRKGGADQTFVFGAASDMSVKSATKTATSAFQRFTYTFTLATPKNSFDLSIAAVDGSTPCDLIVDNIEFFSGNADLGPITNHQGHIYFGRSFGAAMPVVTNGVLPAGAIGSVILPSRYACAKWTFSALVRRVATTTYGFIASDLLNYLNFAPASPSGLTVGAAIPWSPINQINITNYLTTGSDGGGITQRGGFAELLNKDWHQITFKYDGALEGWLDDVRFFRDERALTARNIQDLLMFCDLNLASTGQDFAGVIGFWDRALSSDEIRDFLYFQHTRNATLTVPGLRGNRTLVVEGDSNHGGQSATCWPWLFAANDAPENFGSIWATVGARLDHADDAGASGVAVNNVLYDRAAQVDTTIPTNTYGRTFILTVGVGTNDLAIYPGANDTAAANAFIASLRAYCVARAAAGWQVCLFTIPPNTGATFAARRAIVNADIRTNWALYGLASAGRIIDIAADAIIGPDNSSSINPTYWAGGSYPHFSDTGNALVETYARAVINAIP